MAGRDDSTESKKRAKQWLGLLEATFFRFFAPVSIIGAAELGAPTFVTTFSFYFFLLLPVIDTLRCYLYYNKDHQNESDHKEQWNKIYYASKMAFNIIGCLLILFGNLYLEPLIVPGQAIFIGGVIGLTAIEYTLKAFGISWVTNENEINKEGRTVKNATLATTMFTAVVGMSLLLFFPDIQYAKEPLGFFVIIISNAIPVIGFGLHDRDKTLLASSAIVLAGLAMLLTTPKMSFGLDHAISTEVGIGLGLVLGGFLLATVHDVIHQLFKKPAQETQLPRLPAGMMNQAALPPGARTRQEQSWLTVAWGGGEESRLAQQQPHHSRDYAAR